MTSPSVLSSLPAIIGETFAKIETRLKKEQSESSDLTGGEFEELYGLFGDTLERALGIIDQSFIKLYKRQTNNRTIIEISGSNSSVYRFFPNINYCPCEAYQYHVLKSRTQYTCKHILAAKIAWLTNKNIVTEVMSDAQFNIIVESIAATGCK